MAKVLIVDDQRNMRTTLAMMLRGAGYEVDEAGHQDRADDRQARGQCEEHAVAGEGTPVRARQPDQETPVRRRHERRR